MYEVQISGILSSYNIHAINTALEIKPSGQVYVCSFESDGPVIALHCDQIYAHADSLLLIQSPEHSFLRKCVSNKLWLQEGNFLQAPNKIEPESLPTYKISYSGVVQAEELHIKTNSDIAHIEIDASIVATKLEIDSKHNEIHISDKSMIECAQLQAISSKCFIYGKIFNCENNGQLDLDLKVGNLIIGNNGSVGAKTLELITNKIMGSISGSLFNYGRIESVEKLDLDIKSIKSIKKNSVPKSELALLSEQTAYVNSIDSNQSQPKIVSGQVKMVVRESIEDCSQITGDLLDIEAEEVRCENGSLWRGGIIQNLAVGTNLVIEGAVRVDEANIVAKKRIVTEISGNVNIKIVNLSTPNFETSAKWECETFNLYENSNEDEQKFLASEETRQYNDDILQAFAYIYNKTFTIEYNGEIACKNCTIITGLFYNKGKLTVLDELKIFSPWIRQINESSIHAGQSFVICTKDVPPFYGCISSSKLRIVVFEQFFCSAKIQADSVQISLIYPQKSQFNMNKEASMEINGPLTIETCRPTKIDMTNKPLLERYLDGGIKVFGKLVAQEIHANALIRLEEKSECYLKNFLPISSIIQPKRILEFESFCAKQNAIFKAINYANIKAQIKSTDKIIFDDILTNENEEEVDCLGYIARDIMNVFIERNIGYIGYPTFLTFFNNMKLVQFNTNIKEK